MFERFTDRARRVIVLAQEEVRRLDHNYIGTEHVLLGLIREGNGVAASALRSLGVSLDAVRTRVQEIIGTAEHEPAGHIPFTPRAKYVLELSWREARQLGDNYIGTEHLLLAIMREGEGVAAQVLVGFGASPERVRRAVTDVLATSTRDETALPEPPDSAPTARRLVERRAERADERRELLQQLRRYARHDAGCDRQAGGCRCGLDDVLRRVQHASDER